jgi:magnesium-dependent phosphatase 1
MYTLDTIPSPDDKVIGQLNDQDQGVIGVRSGSEVIRLFPDALVILQRYWNNEYGSNVRLAAASSADTPFAVKIARASMSLLEVAPGVTMRQVFSKGFRNGFEGNLQIGRTPPLSR